MPEGPEVTIITEGLHAHLAKQRIHAFEFTEKGRYHTKAPDGWPAFTESLAQGHVTVKEVRNKGKFIWWVFSNGWLCWQTLGMSGGWYKTAKPATGAVVIYGRDRTRLYYNDQRHFGTFKFIPPESAKQELAKKLSNLGPDMLNDTTLTSIDFKKRLQHSALAHRVLAHVLVDQAVVSGIGNYLRAEILYQARLNPHRQLGSLSDADLSTLYTATRSCIAAAYKAGGTSIRHYTDIENTPGTYGFEMKVYGRKQDPEGHTVVAERIGRDTQTMYWVPSVQV